MLVNFKIQLEDFIKKSLEGATQGSFELPSIELEKPKEKTHGDFSSNVALRCAKIFKKSPMAIAEEFKGLIIQSIENSPLKSKIKSVEVSPPGFINFFLSDKVFCDILEDILRLGSQFGKSSIGKGQKIQIEFVSANPTGPLTVAHARQAAVGDVLGNILGFLGFEVKKEYYINDEGNQIKILGQSIRLRAREILGDTIEFPEDHYQGSYIKDIANDFLRENQIKDIVGLEKKKEKDFEEFGVIYLLDRIKNDLKDFGVQFDTWTSQAKVANPESVKKALESIAAKGHIYTEEGATWFRTTALGDDKDRVVKKSDGQYTYLAPDIAYHKNKFERGFNRVIDILGPDHHGYVARLKAAVQALGYDSRNLDVLIVQLATLYRDGKPLSMSTRKGEFISLREVIDEVGVDAARFFFLMRHIKIHLDFDLELAKEQSPENPVYYIQYAHARIKSIFAKAKEQKFKPSKKNFSSFQEPEEIDLIQKMAAFEDALAICLVQLDPFGMVSYLMDLAGCFHKFYDKHKVIGDDPKLSSDRLVLIEAARIVFANGLNLLGVSVPEKM
ncbi:MAG: arginine--tRNA ligase [Candidatus Omnitrophica bacterium]|nr:arginine--tRNA ligase [Candidatus Omnitrophota bacterium]